MEVSIFLARVIGIYMIIMAISILVNRNRYLSMVKEISKSPLIHMAVSSMALVIGLLMVSVHNVWSGWELLITLFGWLALIKGAFNLLLPDFAIEVAQSFKNENFLNLAGFSYIVIGAFLAYVGFLL